MTFNRYFGSKLPTWVAGNYVVDDEVYSSISGHDYRCQVAGASATDPSADPTMWKRKGPGGLKSVQTVDVTILNGAATGTQTITSIFTNSYRLTHLGARSVALGGMSAEQLGVTFELTNSTTVTARRLAVAGEIVARVQIEEFWQP